MACEVQIFLPESRSLKDKRQVLNSLKERIHNRFGVSIAEVEHNELWQRATLGVAVVSNAMEHANEVLSKTVNFIEQDLRVQVLDYFIEPR
jgi:uncharacterized protein YlxP (DUF503 family)